MAAATVLARSKFVWLRTSSSFVSSDFISDLICSAHDFEQNVVECDEFSLFHSRAGSVPVVHSAEESGLPQQRHELGVFSGEYASNS
jgi:hypothetical protein